MHDSTHPLAGRRPWPTRHGPAGQDFAAARLDARAALALLAEGLGGYAIKPPADA